MNYTMNELESSMSVFYFKKIGNIHFINGGIFTMEQVFKDNHLEMFEIEDVIVLPYIKDAVDNKEKYKVDLSNHTIVKILTSEEELKFQQLEEENRKLKLAVEDLAAKIASNTL